MCCWYRGVRGGGDGAACLGLNRTISPSSNEEVVIYAKTCSPRFHRNLQPRLDSFDPFDFFNFVISHLWWSPPENSAGCGCAGLVRALPYRQWEDATLKISFVHHLLLKLMNEEYQIRLLSTPLLRCPTNSVRDEVTAMIREAPFADGLGPALAYANNRPERTSGWPERWMIPRPDGGFALYLVNWEIPSAGTLQPSLTKIPQLTVPLVVTAVASTLPLNKGSRILEWLQQ